MEGADGWLPGGLLRAEAGTSPKSIACDIYSTAKLKRGIRSMHPEGLFVLKL